MYLSWNKKQITNFEDTNINTLYEDGYVFTRVNRGVMNQTRSLRIDLDKFELSSENKRILRKTESIKIQTSPIPYASYDWSIHKLGKDFYTAKFGDKTFSANKIKELMTDKEKSNFNIVFTYLEDAKPVGYCIALETNSVVHYCYPFYDLEYGNKNIGLGMMIKAINYAKENNKKHIYLGSFSRDTDTYKLQFAGLEWFDGKKWDNDLTKLKQTV